MDRETTTRLCSLESAVGGAEACPEEACPFWESDGATLQGHCAFEPVDFAHQAPLAEWLLDIRHRLDSASSAEDARAELSHLRHLLNEAYE